MYSRAKFVHFVYICITREKSYHFCRESGNFSARNTNIHKIWKLRTAIFSVFYNISSSDLLVLLISRCPFKLRWRILFFLPTSNFSLLLCKLSIVTLDFSSLFERKITSNLFNHRKYSERTSKQALELCNEHSELTNDHSKWFFKSELKSRVKSWLDESLAPRISEML